MATKITNCIKEHRKLNSLTQEKLSRLVGVSRQSIVSIERGRYVPSLELALKIARVFRCPTEDLFYLDWPEYPE
jgi:putative transcriptional regulator